jgi:hypothetical protein
MKLLFELSSSHLDPADRVTAYDFKRFFFHLTPWWVGEDIQRVPALLNPEGLFRIFRRGGFLSGGLR